MKNIYFKLTIIFIVSVQLICCADRFPSSYMLEFPETPEPWVLLLGEPHWRLEWLNVNGLKQIGDYPPGLHKSLEIELPVTWANPVTAWPYWPEHNLNPGVFKPAGTLFPFDVKGSSLSLSWNAGPDTVFYWELAFTNEGNYSRLPANFDWPRFRELFRSDVLAEAVREDPWLIDWRSVAERTSSGNFDRRRLVPEPVSTRTIPVPAGTWYGTSPFAKPLVFTVIETLNNGGVVFPVRSGINVWISTKGILRISTAAWFFIEWE
ncbi:MAG: hypothetical protein FWD22_05415 [Treponema sp.]|nr:hypothetical protein [Treponema sp.]